MTVPIEAGSTERPVSTVSLAGHEFLMKKLTDVQILHLARHARVLIREEVSGEVKLEAAERMFNIIHSAIVDPEQLQFLIGLEEAGEVDLSDLTVFAKGDTQPQPVVRRRGRPRKSS